MKKTILVGLTIGLLAGCSSHSSPLAWTSPTAPPTVRPPAATATIPQAATASTPQTDLLTGVYEKGVPQSWTPVADFATAAKASPRMVGYYSGWYESFKSDFAQTAWGHGAYVFVQMEPWKVSCASIAAGKSDAYLRSYADAVRAFGHPVMLSFGHEPNGEWYPWGEKTPPRDYVAAWRHVVTVFRQQGADNVTWLWVANIGRLNLLPGRYPGAAYVSWIGVTGYLSRPTDTFSSVLKHTINYVRRLAPGKPLILDETGVAPSSDRPAQISNLFAGARAFHLLGLLYFDLAQTGGQFKQNWRLEGDPAALAAFRRGSRP